MSGQPKWNAWDTFFLRHAKLDFCLRPGFEKGTELKFDMASELNGTFKTTGVAALNLS